MTIANQIVLTVFLESRTSLPVDLLGLRSQGGVRATGGFISVCGQFEAIIASGEFRWLYKHLRDRRI